MSEPPFNPPPPRNAGWGAIALLAIAVILSLGLLYTSIMPVQMEKPHWVESVEGITPSTQQP